MASKDAKKDATLIIKVDLACSCCYKKMWRILCKLQEKEKMQLTTTFDEKSKTVTVSGPFDAQVFSQKIKCMACKCKLIIEITIKVEVKTPPPPPPPIVCKGDKKLTVKVEPKICVGAAACCHTQGGQGCGECKGQSCPTSGGCKGDCKTTSECKGGCKTTSECCGGKTSECKGGCKTTPDCCGGKTSECKGGCGGCKTTSECCGGGKTSDCKGGSSGCGGCKKPSDCCTSYRFSCSCGNSCSGHGCSLGGPTGHCGPSPCKMLLEDYGSNPSCRIM